jgi:hypothetical protein
VELIMAITSISDIIVPSLFNPYVTKRTMELSSFVQSGVISNDSQFDSLASQASPLVNMPYFQDLTGQSEQIVEGTDLTAMKITSSQDVACIIRRAAMWSSNDLSAALSGTDPMAAIGNLVGAFWARDLQKELFSVLTGIFASASMSDHILDITALSGNAAKWSASAFIDANQLLGDSQDQLTAIAMHSAVKSALKKQNLLTTERPSGSVEFDTYQGKRVIVDDAMPVDGSQNYTTYLFGAGALAMGNGSPTGFIPTEIDRDKKKGSGVDYLINRKTYMLHPRGIKFNNASVAKTEGPSRAELALAANWTRVYESKAIRVVAFKHKI